MDKNRTSESTTSEPEIAGERPILTVLPAADAPFFWCACGRSKTQPFCDGSHKGTNFRPLKFHARADREEALLCACKRTKTPPYCDGSHNQLKDVYREASAEEVKASELARLVPRSNGDWGRAVLDGGCFVLTPERARAPFVKGWRISPLVDRRGGVVHLSQCSMTATAHAEPIRFSDSEAVLFFPMAPAAVTIGHDSFAVAREGAVCIKPGESFFVRALDGGSVEAIATVCPSAEPEFVDPDDVAHSNATLRVGESDPALRQAMGDRYYQVLIDETRGAEGITQFIGEIPKSRAAAHRHLYEEALLVLSGKGWLWTENAKAEVRPGDVIFLPRKQLHSLECTSEGGMRLAGAFYPSGSPAINY